MAANLLTSLITFLLQISPFTFFLTFNFFVRYKMRQINNTDFTFKMANRAYFDQGVKLNSCLQKVLSNELRVTDMSKGAQVAQEVNSWVSDTTQGRIKKLLKPSDVSNSNMILTNAAFFKGV